MGRRAAIIGLGVLAVLTAGRPAPAYQQPPDVQPIPPPLVGPPVPPQQQPKKEPDDPLAPFLPRPVLEPEVVLPDGSRVTLPQSARQVIRFSPRYGTGFNTQAEKISPDTRRIVHTGGVVVNVVYLDAGPRARPHEVEFATDTAVVWVKGAKNDDLGAITAGGDEKTEVEAYLAGNVVIRTVSVDDRNQKATTQTLRADEIYYDVSRNRAIALCADLEVRAPNFPDAFHVRGRELWQLSRNEARVFDAETYSSKLPANPGLKLTAPDATLIQRQTYRRNIFGLRYRNLRTGEPEYAYERTLLTRQAKLNVYDFPILFLPRTRTNIEDPLGPLVNVGFGNDQIFGTQIYTTFDVFDLIARRPPVGHKWRLYADYFSERGPALGTEYDYTGEDFFGIGRHHDGFVRMYGLRDDGIDNLGGQRPADPPPPEFRGRFQWRHNQDLYEYGTTFLRVLSQVDYLSDKNFLEQYYKWEFDTAPNQETFAYVYGAAGNLGGGLLVKGNWERDWVTETEWLPRLDGYLIGESFFNFLSYSARADVGYAGLRPSELPPAPVVATDQRVDTGRFHLNQRLSAPFDLGPLRLDPYGVVDVAHYTDDLTGNERTRLYSGGGAKASVALSRLYPGAESELFNVRGLYHKVNLGANFYAAHSDTPYTQLPQLDRLNDDTSDFAYRLARPAHRFLIPGPDGEALTNSPIFDPQRLAIRKLVENRADTLDSIQVFQFDARQRLQTKRGYPGLEHTVDWVTLDLSMSVFPDKVRDNFGESTAFLEYYFLWHLGDRTSLASSGWFDPFDVAARYVNLGAYFNRPDGTNFYLGYRHTDPIDSRAVTGYVNYQLTRKYSVTFSANYDFGSNQALSNQLSFARIGTDVTVVFGFTYNAIVSNFGFQFALVPNLAALNQQQLGNTTFVTGRRTR